MIKYTRGDKMSKRIISHQLGFDSNYKTWHVNNSNMIIFMYSDGGSIVCNEKIYPIKRGVLCFVGAQKYHYTMPEDTATYERSKLFVLPDELGKMTSMLPQKERFSDESFVYAQIPQKDISAVEALFDEISRFDNDQYSDMIFTSCFMRLLVFVSQNIIDAISLPHGQMHKAIGYINSNIENDLSINDICEHVHMSKYHFCRSFKKATGLTVMEYILKTRIILAKNMLSKENLAISEVSERCGFSSISYFCRVFKNDTSMTPLQYKKAKRT